jgi:hypothetical protein
MEDLQKAKNFLPPEEQPTITLLIAEADKSSKELDN